MPGRKGSTENPHRNSDAVRSSILNQLNQAVYTITLNSKHSSPQEQDSAIAFLGKASHNPDIAKIFIDALRRFGHHLGEGQKLKIAAMLHKSHEMPPLHRKVAGITLEEAITKERSIEVGTALKGIFKKLSS